MKKWKWFLLFFVVLGFAAAFAALNNDAGQESQAKPGGAKAAAVKEKPLPTIEVVTATTAPLSKTLSETGSVTPTRTARLASPAEGPVESCGVRNCLVREGDRVKKGQVLLSIGRNKAAEAQIVAFQQALQEQEIELGRIEQLVRGGAVPGSQLDTARSRYENARAQLARAMESNEDYSVAAPWDGIVSRVHVAEGDYVAPRSVLLEIFDPESLVVSFAVPEARSTEVREGMPVEVELDAHPGRSFPGKISRVYPNLDERMRTRTVEAALSGPVELLPGMFARIRVTLEHIPEALTVPVEAVRTTPKGENLVFALEGEKAVAHKVKTGIEDNGRVQIVAGLQPGAVVIVAGNEKLKDGARVRVSGGARP